MLRFFSDQPVRQWMTGKKSGEAKIQKFEYTENEKSFFDEIKNFFIVIKGLSFCEK